MLELYRMEEISWERGDLSLYGQIYIPARKESAFPAVIIGHGFTGTYRDNAYYARLLAARGIAGCVFDFCGGSHRTKSDGDTREMSVLTQVEDMKALLECMQSLSYIDRDNIFLMGESQGGFVAALAAAERKEEIKGLIMLYPAFCIPDHGRRDYRSPENIPEEFTRWGVLLGSKYFTDLWDMDVYGKISEYQGDVLIFHGMLDSLVDLSYSEEAADAYVSAELVVYRSGGHGFSGSHRVRTGEKIIDFIHRSLERAERSIV